MYEARDDRYCYPGTNVLKNLADHRNELALQRFELAMTTQRFDEPLPEGRYSVSHYCRIHWHVFQDVYVWAGRFWTVRISRAGSMFCYPEHISREMRKLFSDLRGRKQLTGLERSEFAAAAASFLATLNAIHPFRDGNGRSQLAFMAMLADHAGHPLDLRRLDPSRFLAAMIASFRGSEARLAAEFMRLCE